ncbi:DeoR/GlpR family DNA-binding transcription regulator [Aliiroseovarius sp. CAU 1755]
MSQTLRIPEILELARRDGKVSVVGLAAHFGVTLQTIRRDLSDLALDGRLKRVHGGAILPSGVANIAYEERRALNQTGKSRIARAVARLIPNDCALFLNIGTTTEAVAAALIHHQKLFVVTNNTNVAQILSANPDCQVVVTGGVRRPADGGLVGELAARLVRDFKFDYAVIGCSALDADGDVLDYDLQEVVVSQAALCQAQQAIVVCDHTKLARAAPARIASLSDLDLVVTDTDLPGTLKRRCKDWRTEIMVA